jgi:hypothetical protein
MNEVLLHEKSKNWSNKNKLNPREVSKNSHKKFIFDCDKCDHMNLKSHYTQIVGVRIVLIKNYVQMIIVKHVLKNHLLLKNLNIILSKQLLYLQELDVAAVD